jgi:hypothetical protein
MGVALREQIHQVAFTLSSIGTANTIVPGVAGKIITIVSLLMVGTGANTIVINDGVAGTALSGAMAISANGTVITLPPDPTVDWYQSAVAGNAIAATLTTTSPITGTAWYVQN